MSFAASTLASPTGASLAMRVCAAVEPARGVVQVNHGLAEHGRRYRRFAQAIAARGYHVYVHDHRGHGLTTAPDAPPGSFGKQGVEQVLADVFAVHVLIAREHPGLPVVVFGHSMGGLIALSFLLRHPEMAAAGAIWNATFSAGLSGRAAQALLAWERMRLGSDTPSRLMPRLTFQAWNGEIRQPHSDFDWLSHDRNEVQAYVADPLCGWPPSVAMWQDVFRLIFAGADDRALARLPGRMPMNLVGGAEDPSTQGGAAVRALARRLAAAGVAEVSTTIYPDTRHEGLNDRRRDAITADFADWLDQVVAKGDRAAEAT